MVVCVCVCVPLYYGCLVWIQLVLVRSEMQCIHIDFNIKWAISIFILPFIFHQQIIFIYLWKDIHYVLIFLQVIKTHRDYQCIIWNHRAITLIERCRLCVVGFMIMWIIYNFILFHMTCTACAFQLHIQCTLSVFNCG